MPIRVKSQGPRRRHFITEWRVHRGLSKSELARRVGISKASVTRLESFQQAYTQDMLEGISRVLNVDPAWLLIGPPDHLSIALLQTLDQRDRRP